MRETVLPAQAPTERRTAPRTGAMFVWVGGVGDQANTFAIFRRIFSLEQPPSRATLFLFADTRYRLRVNQQVVAYGPCRFDPKAPQYDEIDLRPYLQVGRNQLVVEAHHRGENSFQAAPSVPGFIAWGSVIGGGEEIVLDTPGGWRVQLSHAWQRESPAFSFALPSVEMLDLSKLPALSPGDDAEEGWLEPSLVNRGFWGALSPRLPPQASNELFHPRRMVFLGSLRSREQQVMFHRRFNPGEISGLDQSICFALWLHSPREQEIEFATFWGRHFVNGRELRSLQDNSRGNRELSTARLVQGWNLFFGEVAVIAPSWGFTIGWPRQAELEFAARPSLKETGTLLVSGLISSKTLRDLERPADQAGLQRLDGFMETVSLSPQNSFPARECAWHEASENLADDRALHFPVQIPRSDAGEGAVVFDFEREWIGHPIIRLICAAPCMLDVANDEALRKDGMLRFYESIHLTNNVDRYWIPAGDHCIESFHERGGRYLQITVRSSAPLELRSVEIRSSLANLAVEGNFGCSDPLLNWVWKTGVDTLQASMTDGWIDPWREQGCYLGDVYVQWLATRMYTPDLSLIQRCFQLWEQCQRSDGQMPAVVPAHYTASHPDYSLTWILLLRDYLRWSNDRETVLRLWPTIERIWSSPLWRSGRRGLWSGRDANVFADWGATDLACTADENLILNAFRVGALEASAEIAAALGERSRSEGFSREAASVADAIRDLLWDSTRGAFSSGLENGTRLSETSLHGNVLALNFKIATPAQERGVLAYVLKSLRHSAAQADRMMKRGGHCDFYFLNFVLAMLHDRNLHEEAFEVVRTFWGAQQERGALTFPEVWPPNNQGIGSHCHGWACSPMISLISHLLGVSPAGKQVMIRPHFLRGLAFASGTFPHQAGPIHVGWKRLGDRIVLSVEAPRGVVRVVEQPGVEIKLSEI